jgi:hypothetical protein
MKSSVKTLPPAVVWSLLVVATGLTFAAGEFGIGSAGEAGHPGPALIGSVLLLAGAKGTLVILDFMDLRRAPLFWRVVVLGWLALVVSGILLVYLKGSA